MRKLGAVVAAGVAALISTSAMAQSAATDNISAGKSELSVSGYATYVNSDLTGNAGFSYGTFVSDTTLAKLGFNAGFGPGYYTLAMRPAVNFYFPSEGSTTVPYITGYGTLIAVKFSGGTSTQYGGGAGVGFKSFFNANTAFGPEAAYEYNHTSGGWDGQAIFKLELSTYF